MFNLNLIIKKTKKVPAKAKIVRTVKNSINIGNRDIDFTIEYKTNIRNIAISLKPPSLIRVRANNKINAETIKNILLKKKDWINYKLSEFENNKTVIKNYIEGEYHLFMGSDYKLVVKDASTDKVSINNNYLIIESKRADNELATRLILKNWYKEQAKLTLTKRVLDIFWKFNKYNLKEPVIEITKMKGKWGLCANTKNTNTIKLNELLILAKPELIDYVIYHELCHLIEHNHGKRFYMLLEKVEPLWKVHKKGLTAVPREF